MTNGRNFSEPSALQHSKTVSLSLLFCPPWHCSPLNVKINSSLAFFLFSFQVHEKTILLPALPILLQLEEYPLPCVWFAYISTFSLVPLLAKDGLMIPFVALCALFLIGAIRGYEELLLSLRTKSSRYASLSVVKHPPAGVVHNTHSARAYPIRCKAW
ncbi:hypothetical protein AVEN_250725-1 [Araneus ventricosus]|uniref:Alpha-1,3-glucosyltransferase n=1 Tax=Araneus ventricosus TaxID=182803 RepID=A0A4Y2LCS7_ARAVE|nr:hypothetical protein AVEN_250725-1 [Araneus ventricosus]